ncbi:enoyl-CoA hydratase [Gallibacterium salpingitidis]|uniref:enoyl-CoA hydratase n=1 Tax=Gallibacterium salpingitidis TaxID=505341 RepID=UPI00266FAB9E|nr:enoyl-CoA hydratase [Gallibacterium salpingitidis]WKT00552.1 enoyl-CoA hydratase [Gallibacterium salpingitidis]
MSEVYLALYKGKRDGHSLYSYWCRLGDWLIRKFTRGIYSHCELAVKKETNFTDRYDCDTYYECYSSSVRDGGVRCKIIDVTNGKWDLIKLDNITAAQIEYYYRLTKGRKYDWLGAIGIILGIKDRRDKFFCSEWCANAITLKTDGWRFSPNDLAVIARRFLNV